MAIPTPPNPSNPIPNLPFYYPETNVLQGSLGPFIIGSSLSVSVNGVIEAVGGGPAVTYLTGGPGIFVSANTGNVSLYNTGVLSIVAGTGIGISGSLGNFTITNTMPAFNLGGTVTLINTGDGLSGGPITTSGTIALSNTGVGAATYTNPTITVDEKGRITAASPGTSLTSISGTAPIVVTGSTNAIISVNQGSPTVPGVVCVSDSVTSTSATTAASSQAVKTAYDLAQAALPCSVLVAQGDLITANTVGAPLRIAAGAEGTYLKVCASCVGTGGLTWGTVSGGGGGTVTSITAGTGLTGGTISASGTIALDTTCVIAPSALSSKGALLTATATATPIALGSGSNGQVLTVNTLCSANLEWVTPTSDIPCSAFNVKGDILVGTGPATYSALPVGPNGQVLAACSSCISGVTWIANSGNFMPTTGGTFTGDVAFYGGVPAGEALTLNNLLPGNSYDPGTFPGITLFGGTGFGAIATVDVGLGGLVGSITLTAGGTGYTVGDVLFPDLFPSGGTGASIDVATIDVGVPSAGIIDCAGLTGTNGQILTSNGANAVCWESITLPTAATPFILGTVFGFNDQACLNMGLGNGVYSLCAVATGERNTFIGVYAGSSALTTASCNSGVGQGVFGSLTSGCNNTAMGDAGTLSFLTIGCKNSAFGSGALTGTDTGCFNVGVGFDAGENITTGSRNVAIGPNSNVVSNIGSCQLAIGFSAADNWLTGDSTKAIKPGAGIIDCAASTGTAGQVLMSNGLNAICWGTAGGGGGGVTSVTGTAPIQVATGTTTPVISIDAATPTVAGVVLGRTTVINSALGCNALNAVTTGCLNVALGVDAASLLTTGRCNTAVGHEALKSTLSSRNNVAVGHQALFTPTNSNSNVAIGMCSLFSTTFGYSNVAIGCCAGVAIDAGQENTLIGDSAGAGITTGQRNVVIGSRVDVADGTGGCQLAIGFNASRWLTGDSNFAIKPGNGVIDCAGSCGTNGQVLMSNGANAICWGTAGGGGITAVTGTAPIQVATGTTTPVISVASATPTVVGVVLGLTNATNTALGCNAAVSLTTGISNATFGNNAGTTLTDGCQNTFIGDSAGCSATFALGHTIIGACAGTTLSSGFYNVFVGAGAGCSIGNSSRNVFIGTCAGCAQTTGSSNVAIGDGVNVPTITGGCQLALGYSSSATCWLTGNSTGAIKPGRGIIDCAGSCGTAGQVLSSNGTNAIEWVTGGGSPTWATLGDKDNVNGPLQIALGKCAGTLQGSCSVAIGSCAGCDSQGGFAVALGVIAGRQGQQAGAVAIGGAAGRSNQGVCAIAIGINAGQFDQGAEAIAIGKNAGQSNQAPNSIVINALGNSLENTVTGTTVIAPVRNAGASGLPAGFCQVAYNPSTGELVYYS